MHVERPFLLIVAIGCAFAAVVWARSSLRLDRASRRIEAVAGAGSEAAELARLTFRKDFHTAALYGILAITNGFSALSSRSVYDYPRLLILLAVAASLFYASRFLMLAQVSEERSLLERRAEEVLAQEELAPISWSRRLAPTDLPEFEGFEVGRVYEPGSGSMAGDFYDVWPTGKTRLAAVIGDVSGHGIEPSITAFQVKYLLRVFLRQFRDPAQALEELNSVLSAQGRPEEFVSLCVAVFDEGARTMRFASAGHPPAWIWHDGEVRPLRATGPLLTLDPNGEYTSRELPLEPGDLLLMYTDGLAEARQGEQLFGEERIANILRRDPGQNAEVLCKSLLESARDFSNSPLMDDVAILAVRRT